MDNIIKTSMRYIIFQRNMACNSFFIRLKCYYLEGEWVFCLYETYRQGIKSAVDFPLRVKFILSLEGGFAYAYNWRIFKHMQGIYKNA